MVRSYKHAIDFIICIPRKFLANLRFPVVGINESKEQAKEAGYLTKDTTLRMDTKSNEKEVTRAFNMGRE